MYVVRSGDGIKEANAQVVVRGSGEFCGIEHAREALSGVAQIIEVGIGEILRVSANSSAVKKVRFIEKVDPFGKELSVFIKLAFKGLEIDKLLIESYLREIR